MRSARLKSNPPAAPMQTPLPEALCGGPKAVLLHWTPPVLSVQRPPSDYGAYFFKFHAENALQFFKKRVY